MKKPSRSLSILLMALCASLWSTAGVLIKLIPWNPLVIAGWRSLIAAGVVLVFMRAVGLRPVVNRGSAVGGALLCLTFLSFVTANKLTTAANAIVLQYTAPIFIMIFSALLFRQKFRRADYLVVAATVCGVLLCFLDHMTPGSVFGNAIAVAAGIFYAGMYIAGGRTDARTRMSGILLGQVFTAAVGLPAMLAFPPDFTAVPVLSVAALGIFQLGVPYVLYGVAAGGCPPLTVCLVSVIEPLLNPVWVYLFDSEAPGPLALLGEAGVVVSVTLWCVWDARCAKVPAGEKLRQAGPLSGGK